jgi:hypothetical protein
MLFLDGERKQAFASDINREVQEVQTSTARADAKGADQCEGPWGSKMVCFTLIFCQLLEGREHLKEALKHPWDSVRFEEPDDTLSGQGHVLKSSSRGCSRMPPTASSDLRK